MALAKKVRLSLIYTDINTKQTKIVNPSFFIETGFFIYWPPCNLHQLLYRYYADKFVCYFTKYNKVFVSAKTLKEYDELQQGHNFLRVHKSHLVNSNHIEAYARQGILVMSDGTKVEVARRKKEFLQQSLGGIKTT
ncbi:MAG: LytTR family transcriptional regulator [Chitinophagaceae bacterium]|nr:LytTR family transcriptional regulator [Chitinophagaceae bacterium]